MRVPHRQSALEMDKLRMRMKVGVALLATNKCVRPRDPNLKVVIVLCSSTGTMPI